tara:strand:+ start:107 stop:1048 length:942 start_codon:yes stop_codon:yes gene_type:complete
MKEITDISLTLFKSIYDNKTKKRVNYKDFKSFEKTLYQLAAKPLAGKHDAMLMSPATYLPDTTRANANVVNWGGWCAIDVDDHESTGDLKNELASRFGSLYYICYSTASSTKSLPKFRLVFPIIRPIEVSEIKQFWYSLNTKLGELGDRQTKDLSRMYYIPADYANAHNFIFTNVGDYINPDELMKEFPEANKPSLENFFDRLPDEMQQAILTHRKSAMDNVNVHWTSYKNCPFFPRKLANEYRTITNTGWYHKMYQIMVATASNAVKQKYPITTSEVTALCRELDDETGGWYSKRPLEKESDRAIEYVYKNN